MKIISKFENISECRIRIKLEIPTEELQQVYKQELKKISKKVKMPGFRIGKVPEKLILQSHGDYIREEVISQVTSKALQQVIPENKIETYGRPQLEEGSYDKTASFEKPFKVNIIVARPPSCKIKSIKKQSILLPTCQVKEGDVQVALEEKLRPFGKMEDVNGFLQPLDIITMSLTFNEEQLKKLNLEDHIFYFDKTGIVTHPVYLQSLCDEIKKIKVGDEVTIKHKFPVFSENNYQELSKKKLLLTIKIKSAKRMLLPNLDAEVLKKLGAKSEDALKEELKLNLKKQVEEKLEQKKIRLSLDAIKKNCSFEIPQEAKNYLISHYWKSYLEKYVPENQREKTTPPNDWIEKATVHAVSEIEDELLLAEIVKLETSLNSTEEEIKEEIEKMKNNVLNDEKIEENLKKQNLEELKKNEVKLKVSDIIKNRKTVEFVLQKTEIKPGKAVDAMEFLRN